MKALFSVNPATCKTVGDHLRKNYVPTPPLELLVDADFRSPFAHSRFANAYGIAAAMQHSCWEKDEAGRWTRPCYELPNGKTVSQADFYWDTINRHLENHPQEFLPTYKALGSRAWLLRVWGAEAEDFIPDFEDRVAILKDFARKVTRKSGGVQGLWQRCKSPNEFLAALDQTVAYNDPTHHMKGNLLVKAMTQARLWTVAKEHQHELVVPLNADVLNVAVKLGMVVVHDPDARRRMVKRQLLTNRQIVELRQVAAEAYQLVTDLVGNPWEVDDEIYSVATKLCNDRMPFCAQCPFERLCETHTGGSNLIVAFPISYTEAF